MASLVGEWDVDALLAEMPAHLFAEWEWFFQLEPTGAMVEELRTGQICALLANINSSGSKTFSAYDFLTSVHYRKPPMSGDSMRDILSGFIKRGSKK